MPNYLDDLIHDYDGRTDLVVPVPDDGTAWLWRTAKSGVPRQRTISGVTRGATTGQFGGRVHFVPPPGHRPVVDHQAAVTLFTGAAAGRFFLHQLHFVNGVLQREQPDIGLWYCHQQFASGDWGASALSTKTATATITGGSTTVTITGGADRFASGDRYVPTGAGRGTADASHGFLKAHAGGDYHGQVAEGWHFGIIQQVIDATHCKLNQAPRGLALGHTITTTIEWGPFPGANMRGARPNMMLSANSVHEQLWGCDVDQYGTGIRAQRVDQLLVRGTFMGRTETDFTLDPPDIDTEHNDCIAIVGQGTRIDFQDSEFVGRIILEDDVTPNKSIDAVMRRCRVHDRLVVLQLLHSSGTGVKFAAHDCAIWNETATGKSNAVVNAGAQYTEDNVRYSDPGGTPEWVPWRAANPEGGWPTTLYGITPPSSGIVPNAPQNLQGTAGTTTVDLTWEAPIP